jgi:hypothetical protein
VTDVDAIITDTDLTLGDEISVGLLITREYPTRGPIHFPVTLTGGACQVLLATARKRVGLRNVYACYLAERRRLTQRCVISAAAPPRARGR